MQSLHMFCHSAFLSCHFELRGGPWGRGRSVCRWRRCRGRTGPGRGCGRERLHRRLFASSRISSYVLPLCLLPSLRSIGAVWLLFLIFPSCFIFCLRSPCCLLRRVVSVEAAGAKDFFVVASHLLVSLLTSCLSMSSAFVAQHRRRLAFASHFPFVLYLLFALCVLSSSCPYGASHVDPPYGFYVNASAL